MAGLYPDDKIISVFGNEVNWPGLDPANGKFSNGDFSNPLKKPSFIPAETINLIIDNLSGFISGLGLVPNNLDPNQLLNALNSLISKYSTTDSFLDFLFPVGSRYNQYLNDPDPMERGLPGDWDIWSHRPEGYGLSSTPLPGYTIYSPGSNYAINAYSLYNLLGDDSAIFKSKVAVTLADEQIDPVKWEKFVPSVIEERRKLQAWTDPDFEIGEQILDGPYAGWYVCEILVRGGKFDSVEGGNRPTYVSGGVQHGRIVNIIGDTNRATASWSGETTISGTGALRAATNNINNHNGWSSGSYKFFYTTLDASLVVPTGPDVAGSNIPERIYRRVS